MTSHISSVMGFLTTSLHKNCQNDVKLLETWSFWPILGKFERAELTFDVIKKSCSTFLIKFWLYYFIRSLRYEIFQQKNLLLNFSILGSYWQADWSSNIWWQTSYHSNFHSNVFHWKWHFSRIRYVLKVQIYYDGQKIFSYFSLFISHYLVASN